MAPMLGRAAGPAYPTVLRRALWRHEHVRRPTRCEHLAARLRSASSSCWPGSTWRDRSWPRSGPVPHVRGPSRPDWGSSPPSSPSTPSGCATPRCRRSPSAGSSCSRSGCCWWSASATASTCPTGSGWRSPAIIVLQALPGAGPHGRLTSTVPLRSAGGHRAGSDRAAGDGQPPREGAHGPRHLPDDAQRAAHGLQPDLGPRPDPVPGASSRCRPPSTACGHAGSPASCTRATAPASRSTARCSTRCSASTAASAPSSPSCSCAARRPRASSAAGPSACTPSPTSTRSTPPCARSPARDEPLVQEQERQPGQKERRWMHLLGPSSAPAPPRAAARRRTPPPGTRTSPTSTAPSPAPTPTSCSTSSIASPSTAGCSSGWPPRPATGPWPTSGAAPGRSPPTWPPPAPT